MLQLLIGNLLRRWLDRVAEPAGGEQPPVPTEGPPPDDPGDPPPPEEFVYPRVQRAAMGSMFEVYLAGTDRESLVGAAEQALDEVESLDRQLSHYSPNSDVTRLNAHAPDQWVRLEPRMYDLLRRCRDVSRETGGAFDVTSAALVKAWGFHDGDPRVPSQDDLAGAMARTGMHRVEMDDRDHLVRYEAPGLEITLGAIGKGYALDEAAETLRHYHVPGAILHGGQSSILAIGAPPGEDAWELTVRDPRDHETPIRTVRLRDEAISTSGNYEQYLDIDGIRYSHILDPRTGWPATGALSVSVIAPNAADSDALSTALFVMSPEERREFLDARPDLRVIILTERSDGTLEVMEHGFRD